MTLNILIIGWVEIKFPELVIFKSSRNVLTEEIKIKIMKK